VREAATYQQGSQRNAVISPRSLQYRQKSGEKGASYSRSYLDTFRT